MSISDKQVKVILIFSIGVHIAAAVIGYYTGNLARCIGVINACSGILVIAYWIQREMRVKQHFFEFREIAFLLLEGVIAATSVYLFLTMQNYWAEVLVYIFFGIHFVILQLALIFMLTFKIKKLF